jgi:hypothetical protein
MDKQILVVDGEYKQKNKLKKVIFISNNWFFCWRTLMVVKDDPFLSDYHVNKDETFQISIGQTLFYTKKPFVKLCDYINRSIEWITT